MEVWTDPGVKEEGSIRKELGVCSVLVALCLLVGWIECRCESRSLGCAIHYKVPRPLGRGSLLMGWVMGSPP